MSNSAQKEIIVQKLRERGCRITKQRLILLDIILEDENGQPEVHTIDELLPLGFDL